ncbi:MAG: hypothetical protein ACM3UX_00200 [Candidatus Woesearchaeota archaeon]
MYVARDVSRRIRSELDDERLGVKFMHHIGRWVVFVRRKMLTGERRWPVELREDGTIVPGGPTIIRQVDTLDDIVWTVQVDEAYHSLDPNLIRQALVQRDSHRRNVAKELFSELARRREAKAKERKDDLLQRSLYYRGAFAKIADDMGLTGRPDYGRIYAPKFGVAGHG